MYFIVKESYFFKKRKYSFSMEIIAEKLKFPKRDHSDRLKNAIALLFSQQL